ncbi:pimeloyl-ACP methyl ester carboxylesterase [Streptomyces sp. 840.1]|uniref:alpha/beta fold hydrolase n=1 Tax=Streptomyces sp. 840.1 TaxID=2485152 RepID=UPI000FC01B04|nr:alpha/beta hydrolase [Streptomyces sp. 840.1]ROQ60251.1 pimeloyl-ACP methyl ester carboxylesterase [Streptomyces sp. 840.1]
MPNRPMPATPPAEGAPAEGLAGFAHHYAKVNGIRLHYVSGGSGEPVVLLHGWPFTWSEYRATMRLLAAAGYQVIAPDLRGFGHSDKPEAGYLKTDVAQDIYELAGQLGLRRIYLVGQDIGMMVAFALAASHPELVTKVALNEALIPGFGLEDHMDPANGGYVHFALHMQVDLATMLTEGKEAAYLTPIWNMMSVRDDAAWTEELLTAYTSPGAMRGGFQHYGTLLDDVRESRTLLGEGKLAMPVLTVNGEHGIPAHQTVESVRRVAEPHQFEQDIAPRSGHTLAEDNPAWYAARLERFFRD